jgi:adenylate kinase
VYLDVSDAEVLRRLSARGRADDKPEIIKNRIKVYEKETGPVVDFYRDKSEFLSVKAEGDTAENISKKIIQMLDKG